MPLKFFTVNSGLSQASVPSDPPVTPMTQVPQYTTITTMRPMSGGFQMSSFQVPNASSSVNPLSTQQRTLVMNQPASQFMSQSNYFNPAMTPNYQQSTSFVLMNANNCCPGQLPTSMQYSKIIRLQASSKVICSLAFRIKHREFNR